MSGEPEACANVHLIPFAGWTLVTAGVAAYATRIQGSRPASNPGSGGLNIVPRAGVSF